MELKNYLKCFFSSYRCLDKMASSIDKFVTLRAINSYYKNLSSISFCGTEEICDDIIELSNKKITLINIKVLTEKVLKILPEKSARFIIFRYMENKTNAEIAKIFGVTERSIVRWNTEILNRAEKILVSLGYDELRLKQMTYNEQWIKHLVKVFEHDTFNRHKMEVTHGQIMNMVIKEYRALSV